MKTILLPGGLGYIGTHTIVEILEKHEMKIVVIDDYSNCQKDILDRLFEILGEKKKFIVVKQGNILDLKFLTEVFEGQQIQGTPIEGIIHFAAKKNANQSVEMPLYYYENNVVGSMNLLKMMQKHKHCKNFIFSSTAAVYGEQNNCTQEYDCKPISPYGESKLCVEMLLKSMVNTRPDWRVISLRYFNPAGSHSSGLIGDWPSNYPGNLFPVVQEFIVGKRDKLTVYGNDYETKDGSGVRDYIHITDLAQGHVKALQKIQKMTDKENYDVFNLGCGCGYSVIEVLDCFGKACGKKLAYEIGPRRKGDISMLVANVEKAKNMLGWEAKKSVQDMCDSCVNFTKTTLSKHSKQ